MTADSHRFVLGTLFEAEGGGWLLAAGDEPIPVEVEEGQPRIPLGEPDHWVIVRPESGLPRIHLDLHASNRRRARKRQRERDERNQADRAAAMRADARVCEECHARKQADAYPDRGSICQACLDVMASSHPLGPSAPPDDRDPSASIRAMRGGLPGGGKRR